MSKQDNQSDLLTELPNEEQQQLSGGNWGGGWGRPGWGWGRPGWGWGRHGHGW